MPPIDDMYGIGYDPRISTLVDSESSYALERHQWSDAARLNPVEGAEAGERAIAYATRGIGAARSGDLGAARKDLAEIESIHSELSKQKNTSSRKFVDQCRRQVLAWLDHADGKDAEAITILRDMTNKESDGISDVGGQIPASEMFADLLLDMKRPQEALSAYEADLKLNPNRLNGLRGAAQAAQLAGKAVEANQYRAELLKVCSGSQSERCQMEPSHSAPGQ
jgi:tetratricopeptide (TPR) repeat protein